MLVVYSELRTSFRKLKGLAAQNSNEDGGGKPALAAVAQKAASGVCS